MTNWLQKKQAGHLFMHQKDFTGLRASVRQLYLARSLPAAELSSRNIPNENVSEKQFRNDPKIRPEVFWLSIGIFVEIGNMVFNQ
jgi:hypothetical protein